MEYYIFESTLKKYLPHKYFFPQRIYHLTHASWIFLFRWPPRRCSFLILLSLASFLHSHFQHPVCLFLKCHISNLTSPFVHSPQGQPKSYNPDHLLPEHSGPETHHHDVIVTPQISQELCWGHVVIWVSAEWPGTDLRLDLTVKIEMKIYFLLSGL